MNEVYLDDYVEEFPPNEVKIPHPTDDPDDAQQFMIWGGTEELNMCGELCVAYIVKNDIESVLTKWKNFTDKKKVKGSFSYDEGSIRKGLYAPHLKDILQAYGYTNAEDIFDLDAKVKEHSLDPDCMTEMLKTHYLVARVKSNVDHAGELLAVDQSKPKDERNHWVVVYRITVNENRNKATNNGIRVEIYNPFPNRRETYSYNEFYNSCIGSPQGAAQSGLWVRRNDRAALQTSGGRVEEIAPTPQVQLESLKGEAGFTAAQYILVDGGKKTELCGEFSVAYILTKSIDDTVEYWRKNESAPISDLVTVLKSYGDFPKDPAAGRSFSIRTVLAYWKEVQPQLYEYHVGENKPTDTRELRSILKAYGYNNEDDLINFSTGLTDKATGQYLPSPGRIREMLQDYFLIAGVGIDGVTGKLKKGPAVRHWEVLEEIEPVGKHYLTSHRGGNGGWVKLYNPFTNVFEEYSYREFTDSMSETGDWGGVWVRRQVKPLFTEQDQLFANIEKKGGKGKKGSHKPDKNNQADKADEKKRLAGIEKILNSTKPANVKTKMLMQAGLSAADIAKRLPQPASASSQPADSFEALLKQSLNVQSIQPEVLRFLRGQSDGDSASAGQLVTALIETELLSIGANQMLTVRSFPSNPDVREADIKSFLGRLSISRQVAPTVAGQLTLKIANAIRPVLASRAIDEIGKIQPVVVTGTIQGRNPNTILRRNPAPAPAYRVMWDWERDDFKEITRPNLPGVFRCGEKSDNSNGHYVDLTREWQFFWFDLCAKVYYGRYHQELTPDETEWLGGKWTSLGDTTTAFTNQHGLDKFRNYVLNDNLDKELPKIYTLVCGGASIAGTPVQFGTGKKSMWMLSVAHFDGTRPPPPVEMIDPYTDPRVFFATTITKAKVKNKYQITVFDDKTGPGGRQTKDMKEGYKVNPFPQFMKGEGAVDCPVPIVANKDIYFPLKDLVAIDNGVKPSPYFRG